LSRTYRGQKTALTRAINSDNPLKVLEEVHRTLIEWQESGQPWPDDWHRWNIAARDAFQDLQRIMADLFYA
jgi:hypothetical protein